MILISMNKRTYKYYKREINSLLKQNSSYLLTGSLVVFAISAFTIIQFRNRNILGVFTYDSSEDSAFAVSDKTYEVMKVVASQGIDYVSPSINIGQRITTSSGLSRPEENGQISESAVASAQVTNSSEKYTVQPGDSLASIAQTMYGDVNAWIRIAQANNITNPDTVEVGMTLVIPR